MKRLNIETLYYDYLKFYKQYSKASNILFNNHNDKIILCKNTERTKAVLRSIKNILDFCLIKRISIRTYFKTFITSFSKTKFYNWISNIKTYFGLKITKDIFLKITMKSKRPKTIHYKYTLNEQKAICDLYYKDINQLDEYDFYVYNRKNLWYDIKHLLIKDSILINKKFKSISIRTIAKMINNDERSTKPKKVYEKHLHPLRTYSLPIGCIQLDLKVIGPKETKLKEYIYVLDAMDEESKFLFTKVLDNKTEDEIIRATLECIKYFKKYGINVIRIRTDNAPEFIFSPFEEKGRFDKMLKSMMIKHEFIEHSQPQENGVIERHHKTIDDEILKYIENLDDREKIKNIIESWSNNFNFKRRHTYTVHKELFIAPFEFVRMFNNN